MKILFSFFAMIFFPFLCISQDITLPVNKDGNIEYSQIINVDSASSSILYSRSKKYITDVFVSGKEVTQLTDNEAKTIIAKGLITVTIPAGIGPAVPGTVRISVNIQSKDGRYKYSFSDFELNYNTPPRYNAITNDKMRGLTKKAHQSVIMQVDKTVNGLIVELKKEMVKSTESEDW